ncbi:phosphatidylglycerophosphatase A [Helicobacter cholecystus]|uniref:Phosphatidylglycerophosphatase A n=2 Tax=Helicobacter cholecystus TaxID=45498 RepID=A0A3D8IUZ0_9HELI|nr:phosphatidylglycerophosphatase A [Helicobacter cholecystus]RDU68820.1 phosphatidylglycerophosphatase A [Helicobacter cholecystus]
MSNKIRFCFLTLFYSGLSPKAPGTVGTLLATLLALPIVAFSHNTLFLLTLLIAGIAIKEIDTYEAMRGIHDDKHIVIDELVGVWIALAITPFSWISIVLCFAFFRLFDITKPSLIGMIDKKIKGGLGVVGDDALAGILSGLCVNVLFKLYTLIGGV